MRSSAVVRGLQIGVGSLLVTFGVIVGGYYLWQWVGVPWQAERTYDKVIDQVREEWSRDDASGSVGDGATETDWGRVLAIVRIPRFGEDYAVPVLQGTDLYTLGNGFGHLIETAGPGQFGNFVIAGHDNTALRSMEQLRTGDLIVVETQFGAYTYRMLNDGSSLTVDYREMWVTDPVPRNPEDGGVQPPQQAGQRLLTLVTCTKEFLHPTTRLIGFAELVTDQPVAA